MVLRKFAGAAVTSSCRSVRATRPSPCRFPITRRSASARCNGKRRKRKKDGSWPALRTRSGVDLTDHYAESLRILGKQQGILGDIYAGAQSRFTNPVNLKKLVSLIDETEWTSLGVDVKAEAYEGLLENDGDPKRKISNFRVRRLRRSTARVGEHWHGAGLVVIRLALGFKRIQSH